MTLRWALRHGHLIDEPTDGYRRAAAPDGATPRSPRHGWELSAPGSRTWLSAILSWRLPASAPMMCLCLASALFGGLSALSIWQAVHQPFLGLKLRPLADAHGLRVAAVEAGPALGTITAGAVINAIAAAGEAPVAVGARSVAEDPDFSPTFSEYNRFFEHQRELFARLDQPIVTLVLADGRNIPAQPSSVRPLSALPSSFWMLQGIGGTGFLIGVAIWSCRRGRMETRLLAVAGAAFMVGALCLAVYGERELTLDPVSFRRLSVLNHLANDIFAYALMILLFYYPSRLTDKPVATMGFTAAGLMWVNETVQFLEPPGHAFFLFPAMVPIGLGIVAGSWQWGRHCQDPVAKASLRWLLLTVAVGVGGTVLLYHVPSFYFETLAYPLWIPQLALLGVYLGLALGIVRYRLFDLGRWWFTFWAWFAAGMLFVAMDLALAYLFRLPPAELLWVAVLLTGWVYFPLRQRLTDLAVTGAARRLECWLPGFIESAISGAWPRRSEVHWPETLAELFRPLSVTHRAGGIDGVALGEYGLTLCVPDLDHRQYVELTGKECGRELFTGGDAAFVESVWHLARQSVEWAARREDAARTERRRIVRDLHDDVGASLLTLVHTAESPQQAALAREALQSLRDSMRALHEDHPAPLDECLAAWREEMEARLGRAHVALVWRSPDVAEQHTLSGRQRINLTRILREAISNILKHARPLHVAVRVSVLEERWVITMDDDGTPTDPQTWRPHVGLSTMRSRAAEIGAQLTWRTIAPPDGPFHGTRFTVALDTEERSACKRY